MILSLTSHFLTAYFLDNAMLNLALNFLQQMSFLNKF